MKARFWGATLLASIAVFAGASTASAQVPRDLLDKTVVFRTQKHWCAAPKNKPTPRCSLCNQVRGHLFSVYFSRTGRVFFDTGNNAGLVVNYGARASAEPHRTDTGDIITVSITEWYPRLVFSVRYTSADGTTFVQNWHWFVQFQNGSCSLMGLQIDGSASSIEHVDSGDYPLHCRIFPGHQKWDAVLEWQKSL